ncbi:MAG: amidase [Holophagales bacterium]|nr:amidase [Holophagales bacterium]
MTVPTGCDGAPDLCTRDAVDLAGLLARGEVSAAEVLEAHLGWIDRRNPDLNAICTLDRDHALEQAYAADDLRLSDPDAAAAKPLLGLPTAVKDLVPTKGIRTTFGSPIFADNVPDFDALIVERIRRAGAVVIGKTNTPEFGAGSQTFNRVFGKTCNPWDPSRTCGGSSGGAAAALASGMLPIADGSDLGGSLRNPASFCGVVGFRPTPGRVPRVPPEQGWDDLAVLGPMGRNVADAALLFSVIAGPDPRDPISLGRPSEPFHPVPPLDHRGLRFAWTPNLDRYPIEREVVEVCEATLPVFRDLGAEIEEAAPDLSGAGGIFRTLRASLFADKLRPLFPGQHAQMKDTVIEEVERGLALTGPDIATAQAERTRLHGRVVDFFERYDALLLPTVQVLPFDVDEPYPVAIEGQPMTSYTDWMASCYSITVTGCPAISVPCGVGSSRLPVGLQIVTPRGTDRQTLAIAAALETAVSA